MVWPEPPTYFGYKGILAQVLMLSWTLSSPPHPPPLLPAVLKVESYLAAGSSLASLSVCRLALLYSFPDLRPKPNINSLCCCLLCSLYFSVFKFCVSGSPYQTVGRWDTTVISWVSHRTVGVLTEAVLRVSGGLVCLDRVNHLTAE